MKTQHSSAPSPLKKTFLFFPESKPNFLGRFFFFFKWTLQVSIPNSFFVVTSQFLVEENKGLMAWELTCKVTVKTSFQKSEEVKKIHIFLDIQISSRYFAFCVQQKEPENLGNQLVRLDHNQYICKRKLCLMVSTGLLLYAYDEIWSQSINLCV